MTSFPTSYKIVRTGKVQIVTVPDGQALLDLRTELELILRFGATATPEKFVLLDARIRRLASDTSERGRFLSDNLAEMRSILADAAEPINKLAAARIDEDFPDLMRAMNMSSIDNESNQYHEDLENEIREELNEQAEPTANGPAADDVQDQPGNELQNETTGEVDTTDDIQDGNDPDDFTELFEAMAADADNSDLSDTNVQSTNAKTGNDKQAMSDPSIENAVEAVAESLTTAEQELESITEGFTEVAN